MQITIRRYLAEILSIRRKTLSNQSINQSIKSNQSINQSNQSINQSKQITIRPPNIYASLVDVALYAKQLMNRSIHHSLYLSVDIANTGKRSGFRHCPFGMIFRFWEINIVVETNVVYICYLSNMFENSYQFQ